MISTPLQQSHLAFRSHMSGNSDLTKSALQVRYRYLQPRLHVNFLALKETEEKNFKLTWAKASLLAKIDANRIIFLPLPNLTHIPRSPPAP